MTEWRGSLGNNRDIEEFILRRSKY